MADEDRRRVERVDLLLVVVDDFGDAEAFELLCVLLQLLDVSLLARPLRSGDGEVAAPEVLGEVRPAVGGEPGAVNQHQGDSVTFGVCG